jgi:hypothetical protein
MSIRIVIQGATAPIPDYVMIADVIRVGSDPSCDLCIPHIDPHALTVQHKPGRCVAFNRGSAPIRIGEQAILPGRSAAWAYGQELQLGPRTILRMETAEVPSPTRLKRTRPEGKRASEPAGPAKEKKRNRPYAILGGCLLVGFLILGQSSPNKGLSVAAAGREFDAVIDELQRSIDRSPATSSEVARVRNILQEARIDDVRGNSKRAMTNYAKVQRLVLTLHRDEHPLSTALEERLTGFIKFRVERLSAR